MTGTLENITSLEDGNDWYQSRSKTEAKDDHGVEALKDITFGSVS